MRELEDFRRETGITDPAIDTYLEFRGMELKGEIPEIRLASGSERVVTTCSDPADSIDPLTLEDLEEAFQSLHRGFSRAYTTGTFGPENSDEREYYDADWRYAESPSKGQRQRALGEGVENGKGNATGAEHEAKALL